MKFNPDVKEISSPENLYDICSVKIYYCSILKDAMNYGLEPHYLSYDITNCIYEFLPEKLDCKLSSKKNRFSITFTNPDSCNYKPIVSFGNAKKNIDDKDIRIRFLFKNKNTMQITSENAMIIKQWISSFAGSYMYGKECICVWVSSLECLADNLQEKYHFRFLHSDKCKRLIHKLEQIKKQKDNDRETLRLCIRRQKLLKLEDYQDKFQLTDEEYRFVKLILTSGIKRRIKETIGWLSFMPQRIINSELAIKDINHLTSNELQQIRVYTEIGILHTEIERINHYCIY